MVDNCFYFNLRYKFVSCRLYYYFLLIGRARHYLVMIRQILAKSVGKGFKCCRNNIGGRVIKKVLFYFKISDFTFSQLIKKIRNQKECFCLKRFYQQ